MPFQKGNKLGVGNKYGQANKGKPSKIKGRSHPVNCPHCVAIATGQKFDRQTWQKNYHKIRRLQQFGLTQEQYDAMYAKQNGACAICKTDKVGRWGTMAIDHNHETGEVRGLLCMTCNTMLGRLEKRWEAVMEYLGV